MNASVAKKASQAVRLLMMALTAVLIFFFINVMLLVSDIQGTARVVNYAGLVRGTTQRIVKLEDAGQPQDDLLKASLAYCWFRYSPVSWYISRSRSRSA